MIKKEEFKDKDVGCDSDSYIETLQSFFLPDSKETLIKQFGVYIYVNRIHLVIYTFCCQ